MSLPRSQWKTAEVDLGLAESLSKSLNLPRPLAMALVARGIDTPDRADKFLNPRLSDMSDPFDLPDMDVAVKRIWAAIDGQRRITVFGDYDVDGITASALTTSVLRKLGGTVMTFLPDRVTEGYGLTQEAFDRCVSEQAPDLIVTVDCGTGSTEVLEAAKEAGLEVVVTDHHTPPERLPETLANINPRISSHPEASEIAGVGVAFKLCHALVKNAISEDRPEAKKVDLRDWLDLVAVGTVADIVPLHGENRILVKHGLIRLNNGGNRGLMALRKVAGVSEEIGVYAIGFMLGPRLNAAGRVGDPHKALELLLTEDDARAKELAEELDNLNGIRKKMESDVLSSAKADVEEHLDKDHDLGVVAAGPGWHPGVIGIVASRLVSAYRMPSVVIGFDEDGTGHGSCRSVEQMNVLEVLQGCEDLLEQFGGHAAAAGLSIRKENLDAFRKRFSELCVERLKGQDTRPSLKVDAWLTPGEFGQELYDLSCQLQPCGNGNPPPLWGIREARVLGKPRVIGKDENHLKMLLGSGGSQIEAIAFGFAEYGAPEGVFDVIFEIDLNTYMGRSTLQMRIKDAEW